MDEKSICLYTKTVGLKHGNQYSIIKHITQKNLGQKGHYITKQAPIVQLKGTTWQ